MAKWDKEYLKLCKKILTEGVEVENRTGINTIKIPNYTFNFDLQEEFPVLTTKQLFFKNAITEILWIYQEQSNDVRWLQERKNHIWDEWMVDADGIYRIYEPNKNDETVFDKDKEVDLYDLDNNIMLDKDGNKIKVKSNIEGKNIKAAKFYGKEYAYTIGTAYGWIVNRYKLTQNLIDTIKSNPNDRRLVMSLWQNEFLKTAVLPSCVWSSEWDVTDGYLNLSVHQRSCDVPLGLPFNVTQYATLLSLIAHCTNLKPGKISWSIKDAHIYVNQIEGIKEQILRGETLEDLEAPELWINEEIDDFFEFDNSRDLKDIKIRKYKHHGKINFPLAQ
ncbi:MAG TPA: thymidylate synthase [Bacilli bacterium]|nr:thymidylate synthase [Bacilli bacterium]